MQPILLYYIKGIFRQFSKGRITLFAQAISFKILLTSIPVVLLLLGILGLVVNDPEAFQLIMSFVREVVPATLLGIESLLGHLSQFGQSFTLIGSLGFVVAAGSLFHTIHMALAEVFETEFNPSRKKFRRLTFNVRMVIQIGVFFVLSILLTLGVQAIGAASIELLQALNLDSIWLQDGVRRTIRFLGILVPFLITYGMIYQLYYFIPTTRPRKRSAFYGASIATLFWEIAKTLFTFYATNVNHFGWYQDQLTPTNSVGSTIGFVLALLVWIYVSCTILLLGAVFVHLHEARQPFDLQSDGTS